MKPVWPKKEKKGGSRGICMCPPMRCYRSLCGAQGHDGGERKAVGRRGAALERNR